MAESNKTIKGINNLKDEFKKVKLVAQEEYPHIVSELDRMETEVNRIQSNLESGTTTRQA